MPRPKTTVLLLLSSAPFLTACAGILTPRPPPDPVVVTEVRTERREVPPHLLACPPLPDPPAGTDYTSRDVALWLPRYGYAAEICRSNIEAIRDLLAE